MSGHQHQWLAGGYDLEIRHFLEVDSMVVSWWIVDFCAVTHSPKRAPSSLWPRCSIFIVHRPTVLTNPPPQCNSVIVFTSQFQ